MAGIWFFKPKPVLRAKVEASPPVVDVILAQPGQYRAIVSSQGTVTPKRQINLVSEVAGKVIEVSPKFEEGSFFNSSEQLLRLDDREYRQAVVVADTQVIVAQRELALEQGQARQAKRVWRELGSKEANALSLRQPQLNAAKAGLRSAKAERSTALLNVERASISVPFDGRIQQKSVALGEFVSVGSVLATVYDSQSIEVRLPLNNQQLALAGFIPGKPISEEQLSGELPTVLLSAKVGDNLYQWPATSIKMDVEIDSATRFYHLIVEIVNPFDSDKFEQPLLVGLFVQAAIRGASHEGVIKLPKKALVDDEHVFVVDNENKLSLRQVHIVDRQKDTMFVKAAVDVGEKIVVSDPRVLRQDLYVEVNLLKALSQDSSKVNDTSETNDSLNVTGLDAVDLKKNNVSKELKSSQN